MIGSLVKLQVSSVEDLFSSDDRLKWEGNGDGIYTV